MMSAWANILGAFTGEIKAPTIAPKPKRGVTQPSKRKTKRKAKAKIKPVPPVFIGPAVPLDCKVCATCKVMKMRTEFYARRTYGTGAVLPDCKPCHIKKTGERTAKRRQTMQEREPKAEFKFPEDV